MAIATVASCNLNQWALDFDGNLKRTLESIYEAKKRGAKFRLGPELELCGYGCEDHFLEYDTFTHCWESLAQILKGDATDGILCDIGMPVLHKNVRYNCRVYCLDRRILLIRPKLFLADDGNYREGRYFNEWQRGPVVEEHQLPSEIAAATGQRTVSFGLGVVACQDTVVGAETCEELWTPQAPHIPLSLDGVEIIANGSGSHHQLRKLRTRLDLILSATAKAGGVYMYANQQGCDGNKLYFDGSALVAMNGSLVAQSSQFAPIDVEVLTARVDLESVRSYRSSVMSRSQQAAKQEFVYPRVHADIALCDDLVTAIIKGPTPFMQPVLHDPMEEIALGPAMWLWDYLRRSGARGFFLSLSGGADSACVAAIVGSMCQVVMKYVNQGNEEVIRQVMGVLKVTDRAQLPKTHQELAGLLLHTSFMGTDHTTQLTKDLAAQVAKEVGAYHMDAKIDSITASLVSVFHAVTGKNPRFTSQGGSICEDHALRNAQARTRMVFAYMLASLLPWVRGFNGWMLVLATGNVDEGLRGYLTKYDCSSGDINPIGSISKQDLRSFLLWAADNLHYPALKRIAETAPTKEAHGRTKSPIMQAANCLEQEASGEMSHAKSLSNSSNSAESPKQEDEEEMGMTYAELSWFGRLRKVARCGPVSMFKQLVTAWDYAPHKTAQKVKHFFRMYGINRHKMTTATPSYHAESYSPDDSRYDHRPMLYNAAWGRQFQQIDKLVGLIEQRARAQEEAAKLMMTPAGVSGGQPAAVAAMEHMAI